MGMEGHRCGTEDASNEGATGKAAHRLHGPPDMGKDNVARSWQCGGIL